MDDLITAYEYKIIEAGCAPVSGRYGLQVDIPNDISPVFPYLNAVLKESRYDHQGGILIWREEKLAFALRSHEIKIVQEGGLKDAQDSSELVKNIVGRINSVWRNHETINPCFSDKGRPPVIQIYNLLPRTNCKQCGYTTCLQFASDLREDRAKLEWCSLMLKPEHAGNKQKLNDLLFRPNL